MSRWPLRTSYFWQEAPFFRPLLFLIAGIVCYDFGWIGRSHLTSLLGIFSVAGLALILLAAIRLRTIWLDSIYTFAFGLFFTAFGWCLYATSTSAATFGHEAQKGSLTLVRIKEEPQLRPSTTKFLVTLLAEVKDGQMKRIDGDALLYCYHTSALSSLAENDTLLVPSGWQQIQNRGNPFELDNAAIQRRKGVAIQQFLLQDKIKVFGKSAPGRQSLLSKTHAWCDRQLKAYISDTATLGLMQAMLLGDESGFDPELRQAYSQTGVIHVVSISGSHVAVLYLVVTSLLFWIKGRRGTWVKYIISMLLVWMYVLIAGGPPSALRSALMFTVLALCTISEREGNFVNTLCSAAFALLLYQPGWLFSVGFQLSFGAVLSIMLFYQPIYKLWYLPKKTTVSNKVWQAISASLAAEILTAPLVIYYFHNFPLLFLLANLLAAALAGFCALIGGMAIIALCWIPPLAHALGWTVTWLVHLFNGCIVWMQGMNVVALQHLQINAVALLLTYLLIVALAVLWLQRLRAALSLALGAACLLLTVLTYDHFESLRQQRLIVYNNGKEPAVELISGQRFHPLAGIADGYSTKAAHIGFHAWKADTNSAGPYFSLAGKKIFLLTDSTRQSYASCLPVDVLIIARPLRLMQVGAILRAFSPGEVVLALRPSAYHLQRWRDSCAAHGVRLHNVAENGAYVRE